jgi:hypothetical protein
MFSAWCSVLSVSYEQTKNEKYALVRKRDALDLWAIPTIGPESASLAAPEAPLWSFTPTLANSEESPLTCSAISTDGILFYSILFDVTLFYFYLDFISLFFPILFYCLFPLNLTPRFVVWVFQWSGYQRVDASCFVQRPLCFFSS